MATDQRSPFSLPTSLTSTSIFRGVTVDSSGNAVAPSAGGTIIGVMYGLDGTGTYASIRGFGDGLVKLQAGGTVTKGDNLKVTNTGAFITASGSDTVVAVACTSAASGEEIVGVLVGAATHPVGGTQAPVLGTDVPSHLARVLFVSTTGTATGALAAGFYAGQMISVVQSVAASTPVGTITGAFANQAGAAKTTLALGTAVAFIGEFCWNGAAWQQVSALGGTGSGLS